MTNCATSNKSSSGSSHKSLNRTGIQSANRAKKPQGPSALSSGNQAKRRFAHDTMHFRSLFLANKDIGIIAKVFRNSNRQKRQNHQISSLLHDDTFFCLSKLDNF